MALNITLLEDVLNDTLLAGSLAASIFVKNPNSQNTAALLIKNVASLLQVIEGQLPEQPAPTSPTPAS